MLSTPELWAWTQHSGAGMAQWLERRTRDRKVAGSNPCWSGGRIFFSRVSFLCWLLLTGDIPHPELWFAFGLE